VIQLQPDNLRGYNNLGAAYQQLGRYEDAIRMFSRTIKVQPTPQAYSNLGTCYYFLARADDAVKAFETATQLMPSKYLYWSNLGDALRWSANRRAEATAAYNQAIALARKELALNPREAAARATLAVCLAKTNRPADALREIHAAIAEDSSNPNFLYKSAVIDNLEGRQAEAVAALGQAVARGYNKTEVQRDPEFANLRAKGFLRDMPK
jgi:tetratricopeptide (TPR) repeat protein